LTSPAPLPQVDISTLEDELSSQLDDIKQAQEKMNEKLEDGPHRVIPHEGFKRMWARYIRATSVSIDEFVEYMHIYLTDDEKGDPTRVEAVWGHDDALTRLKRALDMNANGDLTPLELRKAIRSHMDLPAVLSITEAMVGQARRIIMPVVTGRSYGSLQACMELQEKIEQREIVNIVGESGVGKTHWLLVTGMNLSVNPAFTGEIFYQDLKDASTEPQLRSALLNQLAVRGNTADEVRNEIGLRIDIDRIGTTTGGDN